MLDLPPFVPSVYKLTQIETNEEEVRKILLGLNIYKASGYDNISNRILKWTANSIANPLSNLFNQSFSHGIYPDIWKKANVSPIFKLNDKQDKNNYRPISLLPNLGKIQERVAFKHIYSFCMEHNILIWRNSGYKPLDSSINQMIFITHQIYKALENGDDVCFVSLDASAAFDRVWQKGLLYKLRCIGIAGPLYLWLESYLTNRLQRVTIKGQSSEWTTIPAGVPQGSILGPLLFLIYTNDIINNIDCEMFLYADDTSILEVITDPLLSFDRINSDLNKLQSWSRQWLVNFNPDKTKFIVFSKKLNDVDYPDLFINDRKIKRVSHLKQLGINLNKSLTWELHIKENCKKAMNRLTALKKIGSKLTKKSRLTIYISFIRPVLEYGFQLYDNCTKALSDTLEHVQRESLLFITGAYKKTSHKELLQEVGVAPLEKRRKCQKILFMYKARHNMLPDYLMSIVPNRIDNLNYNLRNNENFIVPKSKKNYFLKSFIPSSTRAWNEADLDIKRSTSLQSLKNKLKQIYENKSYYLYLIKDGYGALNHSRIRMGLSALNAQRKRYNFIDNSRCNYCNYKCENEEHFFFHCPAFAAQRQTMVDDLERIVPQVILPFNNYNISKKVSREFCRIITKGSGIISNDTHMFDIVHTYISSTNRFR